MESYKSPLSRKLDSEKVCQKKFSVLRKTGQNLTLVSEVSYILS